MHSAKNLKQQSKVVFMYNITNRMNNIINWQMNGMHAQPVCGVSSLQRILTAVINSLQPHVHALLQLLTD